MKSMRKRGALVVIVLVIVIVIALPISITSTIMITITKAATAQRSNGAKLRWGEPSRRAEGREFRVRFTYGSLGELALPCPALYPRDPRDPLLRFFFLAWERGPD